MGKACGINVLSPCGCYTNHTLCVIDSSDSVLNCLAGLVAEKNVTCLTVVQGVSAVGFAGVLGECAAVAVLQEPHGALVPESNVGSGCLKKSGPLWLTRPWGKRPDSSCCNAAALEDR